MGKQYARWLALTAAFVGLSGCYEKSNRSGLTSAGGGVTTGSGTQGTTPPTPPLPTSVFNVAAFGATPGKTTEDSTPFFQAAISAAAVNGGKVVVPAGTYKFNGVLTLPANVVLSGETPGPFDPPITAGKNPSNAPTGAAVLLVTNTANPFITIAGYNSAVRDFLFYYPNQVDPATAASPNTYPATIYVTGAGARIYGCSFTNSYTGVEIRIGRVRLENLNIGAYAVGVLVDNSFDFVKITNLIIHPFWDIWTGNTVDKPIDTWVLNNGYGIISRKADGLQLLDVSVLGRYAGLALQTDANGGNTFGTATGLQFDSVQYGVIAYSTNQFSGFGISNSYFTGVAGGVGKYGVTLLGPRAGQTRVSPSTISLTGGHVQAVAGGFIAPTAVETAGGTLKSSGVLGVADGTVTQ